jgi:hypothetical protein
LECGVRGCELVGRRGCVGGRAARPPAGRGVGPLSAPAPFGPFSTHPQAYTVAPSYTLDKSRNASAPHQASTPTTTRATSYPAAPASSASRARPRASRTTARSRAWRPSPSVGAAAPGSPARSFPNARGPLRSCPLCSVALPELARHCHSPAPRPPSLLPAPHPARHRPRALHGGAGGGGGPDEHRQAAQQAGLGSGAQGSGLRGLAESGRTPAPAPLPSLTSPIPLSPPLHSFTRPWDPNPPRYAGRKVMLGVDRLDMIKGIPQKLLAFEKFLQARPRRVCCVLCVRERVCVCVRVRVRVRVFVCLSLWASVSGRDSAWVCGDGAERREARPAGAGRPRRGAWAGRCRRRRPRFRAGPRARARAAARAAPPRTRRAAAPPPSAGAPRVAGQGAARPGGRGGVGRGWMCVINDGECLRL